MNPNNQQPTQPGQSGHPPNHPIYPAGQQPYMPQQSVQPGAPQPVAYDQYGNPLYAAPPPQTAQQQPQFVHLARAMQPMDAPIPPEVQQRHEASRKKYPHLNLSPGEYILSAVRRHPIGLLKILCIGFALIVALMALYLLAFSGEDPQFAGMENVALAALGFIVVLIAAGTFVAAYVYNSNRFYLTNESVIQEIQDSLFARHEQTVSLSNIEDASFRQGGILPTLFNYGTIRLSTEGDETTYRFSYVSNPKHQISVLNNAVEAFKNGRPVD